MEFHDHAYTSTTYDKVNPVEFTYKMSSKEIEDFVKLRVSNNDFFSGKRNTSMWAWRAILKHMGLQHKMTHSQASKKWENMKKRYKVLKNPTDGMKVFPEMWPYFTLMDDAMEGRLKGKAPILTPLLNNKANCHFLSISKPQKRKLCMMISSPTALVAGGPDIEVPLNGDGDREEEAVQEGNQEIDCTIQEAENERNTMDGEWQVMEREKRVMERERLVLQRDRAVLDREIAALDRDRASLERERAAIDREKAVIERERVIVEKDRDAVSRDRLALEQEKARLERLFAPKGQTVEVTDSRKGKDSDVMDRREHLLYLFEKLIENF